jgi:hypothetical protein
LEPSRITQPSGVPCSIKLHGSILSLVLLAITANVIAQERSSNAGKHLFPSVITYASLSQIAVPANNAEYDYYVSKIDYGHGSDTVPGMVQRSATFFPFKYDILQACCIGSQEPEYKAMQKWFAVQGCNYEDAWLHYSDDSQTVDRSGNKWTVRGWGNGSAKKREDARVRSSGGFIYNHANPCVIGWLKYKFVQSVKQVERSSKRPLYRGVFIDSMMSLNTRIDNVEIPKTVSGGHIIEYGNQTVEQIVPAGVYQKAVIGAESAIKDAMHSAVPGSLLLLNLANETTQSDYAQVMATDGYLSEWFDGEENNRSSRGSAGDFDFVKSLTDKGKVFVWSESLDANTVPKLKNINGCNYSTPLKRHQMYSLTNYWIAKQGDLVWFEQRPIGSYLGDFWYKAQERNVGEPKGSYTIWETGKDAAGQNFRIYRRDYSSGAIMLNRSRFGWNDADNRDYGTKTPLYNLNGSYRILYSDNTLGPVIQQVGLCLGEAVTLIPANASTASR